MNRKEAMSLSHQEDVLLELGFTQDEADKLRRISMTLRRWHELECGTDAGCIEREGEDGDGKPFMTYERGNGPRGRYAIPDREKGAHKRLAEIIAEHNERRGIPLNGCPDESVTPYIQTDPRGAALYILRPGDVPEGKDASAYYSRGICVY
mgnify:CR=1 FL=1